tara:strand:+ start:8538 stop:10655 length:2118 start_codon:yes stop_codon:yes gene_type:complete
MKNDSEKSNGEHSAWVQELGDFQSSDLDQREQARECDRFLLDKDGQWEESVARTLDSQKRPRYTFDQTTPAIEFIMSDIEDMDFSINVKPHSGEATKELALLREDIIRSIENDSNATKIYRDACRRLVRRGFDAWIVKAKYRDAWSFEQDLVVEAIPNAINRVWVSNTSSKADSSDSDVAFILTSMSPSKYKTQWPEGSGISIGDDSLNDYEDNYKPEVITIGEKYYKKETTVEVVQMSNGEVLEVDDKFEAIVDELSRNGITETNRKKVKDFKIYHRFFDGGGMLSPETETVFKTLPVVTVYGNHELLGESSKVTYHGLVLKEMDYQRVYNYAKSREIEEGALAPRKKLIMTKKMAAGNEKQIAAMNVSADPVLFINPDPEHQQGVYETQGAQPNSNLNVLASDMALGIQTTGGVNNAMNGNFAGRMSEGALKAQIDRGQGSTRKWVNALVNGIRRTGQILIEALPVVYDTKRQFMLIGMDGTETMSTLNDEKYEMLDDQTGKMIPINNLNAGKYKVFCDAGPAFANRMEAGLAALLEYAAIDPSIVQQGGDIMLKAIDAPLVDKLAERKREMMLQAGMIPENQMTDEEKEKAQAMAQQPQEPSPQMVMAQAEMLKGQADLLEQQNRQAEMSISAGKIQAEAISRSEKLQSETQLNIAKITQNQQKIDNDARDKFIKNAIAIAELEFETQQSQNANIQDNLQAQ